MTNSVFRGIGTDTSSIKGLNTNLLGACVFAATTGLAWIPLVGYFAIALPIVILFLEKKSLLMRFYCAEAILLGGIRLLFDVVFNSIADIARQTVALYGQDPAFVAFYGNITNPGGGALIVGAILGGVMTLISLGMAFLAYFKVPVKLPGTATLCRSIAEFNFRGKQ